jgi:LmbE family N-acetylglucosaminyl deacetylase
MVARGNVTPASLLSGRVLIVAPHMDDEVLGCGGSILMHKDKTQVYCTYVTDGARSPAPLLPWTGSIDPNIKDIRRNEAYEVMREVGIPKQNLQFLDFPDGKLKHNLVDLKSRLSEQISRIEPDIVLAPFRYDLHPDHVALTRCVRSIILTGAFDCTLLEYFIYFRWRLIASGDIRQMIDESNLLTVDTRSVADRKSSIIRLYRSQTDVLGDWQENPILTAQSISQRCREPETFLHANLGQSQSSIFTNKKFRILVAHYIERIGKRPKDQVFAFIKWLINPRRDQNA